MSGEDNNREETHQEEENEIPVEVFQNIQNKLLIQTIEQRMATIKQYYFNPQTLEIDNYNLLRSAPGQHWKSKIYTLFCDAYLPHYWIVDIYKNNSRTTNEEIPTVVYIQLMSFPVKMFVKKSLTNFFKDQNININVYD
jgi:hypothetical protein